MPHGDRNSSRPQAFSKREMRARSLRGKGGCEQCSVRVQRVLRTTEHMGSLPAGNQDSCPKDSELKSSLALKARPPAGTSDVSGDIFMEIKFAVSDTVFDPNPQPI